MGARGPVAAGKKRTGIIKADISTSYFLPEPGMGAAAKKLWRRIVASMPAGYFREGDRPILRGFCEHWVLMSRAGKEMGGKDFEPVYVDDNGKRRKNPWIDIYKDSLAEVKSTATKLRITRSTQISPKGAGSAADKAEVAQKFEDNDPWSGLMFDGEAVN